MNSLEWDFAFFCNYLVVCDRDCIAQNLVGPQEGTKSLALFLWGEVNRICSQQLIPDLMSSSWASEPRYRPAIETLALVAFVYLSISSMTIWKSVGERIDPCHTLFLAKTVGTLCYWSPQLPLYLNVYQLVISFKTLLQIPESCLFRNLFEVKAL